MPIVSKSLHELHAWQLWTGAPRISDTFRHSPMVSVLDHDRYSRSLWNLWPWPSRQKRIDTIIIVWHYSDVIMGAVTFQVTNLTIIYLTVYSGADERKHQSSSSLAFVWGIHWSSVNSPHKWPVTRKMFPFDDVKMAHRSQQRGRLWTGTIFHWAPYTWHWHIGIISRMKETWEHVSMHWQQGKFHYERMVSCIGCQWRTPGPRISRITPSPTAVSDASASLGCLHLALAYTLTSTGATLQMSCRDLTIR